MTHITLITSEEPSDVCPLNFIGSDTIFKLSVVSNVCGCIQYQVVEANELAVLSRNNVSFQKVCPLYNSSLHIHRGLQNHKTFTVRTSFL
jgi:hypothetical protein